MKTIQIELPEAIEEQLSVIQDQQYFIVEAIGEKIKREESLTESLIEGYQTTYDKDLAIANDFESADFDDLR